MITTHLRLRSLDIDTDTFRKILTDGFNLEGIQFPNPWKHYDYAEDSVTITRLVDIHNALPYSIASGEVEAESILLLKISYFPSECDFFQGQKPPNEDPEYLEYVPNLISYLQTLDKDMMLTIQETDDDNKLTHNLFFYHGEKKLSFYFDPTTFASEEDLVNVTRNFENGILGHMEYLKSSVHFHT